MSKLHDIAEECATIAHDNGFDRSTWENLVPKLAFVITEIDEARDGAHHVGNDPLPEELADTAIRLLSSLHGIWGRDWGDRVTNRRLDTETQFHTIETLLWPILSPVAKAIEKWRFDSKPDVRMYLEIALLRIWQLADVLGVDIDDEIRKKCEKNRGRAKLHGKSRSLG